MKWNTLLYSLLFSGLGIFSFLLLANYTNLTPQVTNTIHTPGAFVFVVATFNILGYCTLRISSWMNRLYSNNLRWKWKFIAVYIGVMLLFSSEPHFLMGLFDFLESAFLSSLYILDIRLLSDLG